jgi:hypothetical protein
LLFTTRNINKLENVLKRIFNLALEIIKLWNDEVYLLDKKIDFKGKIAQSVIARVEFKSESLIHSWWYDTRWFEQKHYNFYSNYDLTKFSFQIANLINDNIIHGEEIVIKTPEKDFLEDFISGIKHLSNEKDKIDCYKNIITGNKHEGPFRDFFSLWFAAKNYKTDCESLRGNNHIDLKIEHDSIIEKIVEFKGWWNKSTEIILQVINYLTQFNDEGYIFMINHTQKDVITEYKRFIEMKTTGYVLKSWKKLNYEKSSFCYYKSSHKMEAQTKTIYHFIFNIERPKKVHNIKSKSK